MTDVDYERVAREFLGWVLDPEDGHWRDSQRRSTIYPGASWPFFGACWEECKRRGLSVFPGYENGKGDGEYVVLMWGDDMRTVEHHADPRVALPACIIQWLDAQGGTHD